MDLFINCFSNKKNEILKQIGVLQPEIINQQENITVSNKFDQTTKGKAYLELYFWIGDEITLYNSFVNYSMKNNATTCDVNELIIPEHNLPHYIKFVYANTHRFFIADMTISFGGPVGQGPDILYFKYKNSNMNFAIHKTVSFPYNPNEGTYIINTINRSNIWVYYPYTQVYMLIHQNDKLNSYGFSIWILVGYTTQKYPLTLELLPYLGTYLVDSNIVGLNTLPNDLIYSMINLSSDTYLNVVALSKAQIMQDALNNTYQYLDPTYCDFLYNNIATNKLFMVL